MPSIYHATEFSGSPPAKSDRLLGVSVVSGAGLVLLVTPIVAFIAMNFTGSSTFTSQPGAALEVRRGILPIAASVVLGIGLSIAARAVTL